MSSHQICVNTAGSFFCHAITNQLEDFVRHENCQNGLVVALGQHTTTDLIMNEMEEKLMIDLQGWLERLAPFGNGYKHGDFI